MPKAVTVYRGQGVDGTGVSTNMCLRPAGAMRSLEVRGTTGVGLMGHGRGHLSLCDQDPGQSPKEAEFRILTVAFQVIIKVYLSR